MSATDMKLQQEDLLTVAKRLARANAEAVEEMQEIYLFPHDSQIRLVEVDPITMPSERVEPFYFSAAPESGIPYRSAVALILPEEKGELHLPEGWGTWEDARKIWPED